MECNINLNLAQHKEIFRRKNSIQSRFKIQIETPVSFDIIQPDPFFYKGFSPNEILIISVKGEASNVEAFQKYVLEAFVQPEIVEFFTYQAPLERILGNRLWIDVLEEIFGVCISIEPDCELNISGTESSVLSTVSLLEELMVKYKKCKDTLLLNEETSLAPKLVTAFMIRRNTKVSLDAFDGIPNDVISFLLSLLERAWGDNFPVLDSPSVEESVVVLDSHSLEESVVILDPPENEMEASVIVLDSDGDYNSGKTKKKRKKNKTPRRNGVSKKGRPLLFCEKLQDFEKAKVAREKASQPIIDNSSFIPLSLNTEDSAAKVRVGQVDQQKNIKPSSSAEVEEPIPEPPRKLRPIVIDGCNVGFYNTKGKRDGFSWKRIEVCMHHFLNSGHTDVKVFLPNHMRAVCYEKAGGQSYIENLESQQLLVFTPSRKVDGRRISCYDDRFIVDLAYRTGGVILSNDNYRDLMSENVQWKETIKERLLMFIFAGEELMIPEDPLGQHGPRLKEFLSFPD